jgi:polyisoprenoid-binding protein YceI
MKLLNSKILLIILVLFSGLGYVISCTRDNESIVPIQITQPFVPTRGNHVHLPGAMTAGDTTQWKLDKVHSSVLWSGAYIGAAGLLTGRFNQFGMHDVLPTEMQYYSTTGQALPDTSWAFYESDPSKTYFNGYVQINTSNTGEPGRDTGCNISTMGTIRIAQGTQNLTDSNIAQIKSTHVEFDPESNGYLVRLNLTWRGKLAAPHTEEVLGKLSYVPQSVPSGKNYSVFGLQLTFQFDKSLFGITSTSIGDNISIECNMNFNNK